MANGIFAESQQTSTFLVWPWNITISTASIVWSALLFLFQLYYDYYYYFCNAHFSPPLGAYRVRCASEESNLFGVIVTRSHWDSSHRSSRGDEQHKITVSFFFLFFFIDIHGPSSIARIDVCVCVYSVMRMRRMMMIIYGKTFIRFRQDNIRRDYNVFMYCALILRAAIRCCLFMSCVMYAYSDWESVSWERYCSMNWVIDWWHVMNVVWPSPVKRVIVHFCFHSFCYY